MKDLCQRIIAVALVLAGVGAVFACSVPVFRYALERWQSDNYLVVVFHHGALEDTSRKLLAKLSPDPLVSPQLANIEIQTYDLDNNPPKDVLDFWRKSQASAKAGPWMMVFYPKTVGNPNPVWSGRLNEANANLVVDSPKRRELSRRLLKGESTVWLFLESGDTAKDAAALSVLNARIAALEKTLKLPEIKQEDIAAGLLNIEASQLKLKFSALRVSRRDAAESVFVKMLLTSESDLKDLKEPMVFPVYGRGRFMPALIGKGINDENLTEAAKFLTGPCSCQIKRQNPGTDLLAAVNWESLIQPQINIDRELPPLTGIVDPGAEKPTEVVAKAIVSSEPIFSNPIQLENGAPPSAPTSAPSADATESKPMQIAMAGAGNEEGPPTSATNPAPAAAPTTGAPIWVGLVVVGLGILLTGGWLLIAKP
ncbi:MAG: hypothetical protein CMO66_00575 [Verrucomicrobiales bacterium]|nr:hypothetical protein [Verrucomicrobiales bacterium]